MNKPKSNKTLQALLGLALFGTPLNAFAGEETYYGHNPTTDGQLQLVGFETSSTYDIIDLTTGLSVSSGTLTQGEQISIDLLTVSDFKVDVSDPMMVLLHHDCCNFSGDFFYPPTEDGKRYYGRDFRIRRIAGSTVVFATEDAVVQVFDNMGTLVETSPQLSEDDFWLPTAINDTDTFHLVSTGTISVGNRSVGNGATQVPPIPADATDAVDCNNNAGNSFYFFTESWTTGAVSIFNQGTADANILLTNLSTNSPMALSVPAGSSAIVTGLGQNYYKLDSDQPLSVWAGDTEAGNTIRNMGDDVTVNLGDEGKNFVLDSATQGAYIFAADDNTVLTGVEATPVILNADDVYVVPGGQALAFTSSKSVTVQAIGGNALNDWGVMLRPAMREDRDNDGTPDAVEGACDSVAPDSDGDGVPDYRDTEDSDGPIGDLDGDGIINTDENTLGTSHDNADTDGDGVCDGTADVAGVCVAGEDAASGLNTDGDMLIDALDTDDDGDGISTLDEDVNNDGDPTNDDTDGDGTPNYLDVNDNDGPLGDTDGDGITNGDETTIGTQSDNADTDGDGVCDGVIAVMGVCVAGEDAANALNTDGDMLIDALDPDDDGDGILTVDEDINMDGDPTNDDTDGDMIPNYLDFNDNDGPLGDTDGDGIINSVETMLGTLADNADSDGDGLCDGAIAVAGVCVAGENAASGQNTDGDALIDALDSDDDGDGVLTTAEDANMDGDPTNDDVNASGTPDYLDPCTPDSDALVCPTGDPDDDGVPNSTDPDPTDPCDPDPNNANCDSGDTDGDGLSNSQEITLGTSPDNADTDGDGVCDGTIAVMNVCVAGEDAASGLNTDGDMLINALDPDDDGDGISTLDEDLNNDGDPNNDDTDGDMIPDYLDADDNDGPNGDLDGDGIPNGDEDLDGDGDYDNDDTDGDGTPNYLDDDDDNDGILTKDEDIDGDGDPTNDNSDEALGDDVPNYLDPDDDGDGVNTADEDVDGDGDPTNDDTNADGVPNFLDPCDPDDTSVACEEGDTDGDGVINRDDPAPLDPCDPDPNALACPTGDTDMDGLTNQQERMLGTNPSEPDSDGDGLDDLFELGDDINAPVDTDMDGTIDALDEDDDNDGLLTTFELGDAAPATLQDTDANGVPDYLDNDDDGDGFLTIDENADPNGDGNPDDAVDTGDDGTPDYLDPTTPGMMADFAITSPADGATVGTSFTISGSAAPGSEVEILINGEVVGTAIADENGDWTFDVTGVEPGDITVEAKTDDDTDTVSLTVEEGVVQDVVDITSPADGSTVAADFQVSGTTNPDAEIEILVDGESVGTTTADANGDWTFDITGQMAGDITVEAKVGDVTDSVTVTVDDTLVALDVAISSPVDGDEVTAGDVTVSGTATPDAEVEIFVDGESVGTTTADTNGDWTFDITVDVGDHDVRAEVKDGDRSVTTDTINFTAIAADGGDDDFDGYLLAGGCHQSPAQEIPGSWLMALMAMLGSLIFRRKRD